MFKFLNRTNGTFSDSEVYWSFKSGNISETHSFAEQPTYDMPANSSGRMYFYVCSPAPPVSCTGDPTKSKFFDFIEFTIGAAQYNGNTTRVDAFGLKLAKRLHCADGYDVAVGEDYQTFGESRDATFAKFAAEVPAEFQPLAQAPNAPYRIVEPGSRRCCVVRCVPPVSSSATSTSAGATAAAMSRRRLTTRFAAVRSTSGRCGSRPWCGRSASTTCATRPAACSRCAARTSSPFSAS